MRFLPLKECRRFADGGEQGSIQQAEFRIGLESDVEFLKSVEPLSFAGIAFIGIEAK